MNPRPLDPQCRRHVHSGSAGTFATRREADRAWQRAEAKVAEGRAGTGARGRQTFRRYVEEEWLPHHVMEPSTREGYTYSLHAHAIDWFGDMRMIDILPSHVREWVTELKQRGLSPSSIRLNKAILSAVFTTALNDQVTVLHPCRGVKTPTVPTKPLRIVMPDEFDEFYRHLPDDMARLLVEVDIDSGMRWGELTELRVKDFDFGAHRASATSAAAFVSFGEALGLPVVQIAYPLPAGLSRWADPRVTGNMALTQGLHVCSILVDPCA